MLAAVPHSVLKGIVSHDEIFFVSSSPPPPPALLLLYSFYMRNSKSVEAYPLDVDTLGGTSSGLVPHILSFRPRVSSKTPPSRKNKWENQFLVYGIPLRVALWM